MKHSTGSSNSLSDKFVNVLADQICFDIDFITNLTGAQISVLQGEWDNGNVKLSYPATIYRQADPIDSNGPLGHQQ